MTHRQSRDSWPAASHDEPGKYERELDEYFEGESTGVRQVGSVPEDWGADFRLPSWEELTGIRGLTGEDATASQLALDRSPSDSLADEWLSNTAYQREQSELAWVERFERDLESLLTERDGQTQLGEPVASRPLPVPPPAPPSRLSTQPPPPPPRRQEGKRITKFVPPAAPLPRFTLAPRLDELLGPDSTPRKISDPESLAPLASDDVAEPRRGNVWLAASVGALAALAAALAFLWNPPRHHETSASVVQPWPTHRLSEVQIREGQATSLRHAPPFDHDAAHTTVRAALLDAVGCELPPDAHLLVTFANDGSVTSVKAVAADALPPDIALCLDQTLFELRIPPFRGGAMTIRPSLD